MNINNVDICFGLGWGDEGKGKISAYLLENNKYDFVCRWSGGNNADHTIYKDGNKYVTNLIPSGIFYGIKSIIGPDCVINIVDFYREINYLNNEGFNTNLVKVSPNAHIIMDKHIKEDNKKYKNKLGTTGKGIGPCYRDKYGRTGLRVMDCKNKLNDYIWDEKLYGNILCEGAQGFWLDINYGNYPYITSSNTLPYGACSLGFPHNVITNIYGGIKIYDTRVGIDPEFPEELMEDGELKKLGELEGEYGTNSGRRKIINWLNMDKLIRAINISGTNNLIIDNVDTIRKLGVYKFYYNEKLIKFNNIDEFELNINHIIKKNCVSVMNIFLSSEKGKV